MRADRLSEVVCGKFTAAEAAMIRQRQPQLAPSVSSLVREAVLRYVCDADSSELQTKKAA